MGNLGSTPILKAFVSPVVVILCIYNGFFRGKASTMASRTVRVRLPCSVHPAEAQLLLTIHLPPSTHLVLH